MNSAYVKHETVDTVINCNSEQFQRKKEKLEIMIGPARILGEIIIMFAIYILLKSGSCYKDCKESSNGYDGTVADKLVQSNKAEARAVW